MSRPKKVKTLSFNPEHKHFAPLSRIILKEIQLNKEEIEAIKLKDLDSLDQKEAALKMNISQPTFHRLLKEARKKIASALIQGYSIKIKV